MKNKCSSEIPNMPTGCAPDNRRPEKICGKTGIKNITITRCCKGVYKTAGGYVWGYDLTIKEV